MHDMNGSLLEVGDKVTVEFVIENVSPGDGYCNVGLRSTRAMPGNKTTTYVSAINTNQVLLTQKATKE